MVTRIGVVGGGQLCRMMGEEIKRKDLPFELIALDPTPGCPAAPYVSEQLVGDFKDPDQIRALGRQSDVLTYEIELARVDVLEALEREGQPVHPSPATLRIIQDKSVQASFLRDRGISVPDFREISGREDLVAVAGDYGLPVMVKARTDSYDGRGNFLLESLDQVDAVLSQFAGRDLMAQRYVNFDREVSVIAARNTYGEIATYPVGENIHADNILNTTLVPARVSGTVADRARDVASQTLDSLQGAGVFGIEMFVDGDGAVMINEIAPRVHNSGHYTIEGCATSQFEQHLRAITGMPLGNTDLAYDFAVMQNVLGDTNGYSGPYILKGVDRLSDAPGVHVHMYGKAEVRGARKMGHVTLVGNGVDDPQRMIDRARELGRFITFKQSE